MGSEQLRYWEYDPEGEVRCPRCGWTGRGSDHETEYRDLLDVTCPKCRQIILIVTNPTLDETRDAAAHGDPRAAEALPFIEEAASRYEWASQRLLDDPAELPELKGDAIRLTWDFEEFDEEHWTVLRHNDREIWREPAFYEAYERFEEVFDIPLRRYGQRLAEVRPSYRSEYWLYGDKLNAPEIVARLNASLGSRSG